MFDDRWVTISGTSSRMKEFFVECLVGLDRRSLCCELLGEAIHAVRLS